MKTKYILILSSLLLLTACSTDTQSATIPAASETISETTSSESTSNTSETTSSESDEASTGTTISFGDSVDISGSGATLNGNTVEITESGTYTLTGTSTNYNVIIDNESADVDLIFSDLNMTYDTAAIQIITASSATITLEGDNYIEDSSTNTEYQAPIYIDEVETTIDGEGNLNLTGNAEEGFESNNDLIINGGTINVTAADDGLNVGDNLIINGGNINIDSEGDGLDSNGSLEINGGTTIVAAGNNGNGPIDYNSEEGDTFELTGGTLIAVGGNMGVSTTTETQLSRSGTASGSTITVDGTEYNVGKSFSYYFVSTPDLTEDTEILVDGSVVTDTTTNTTPGGMGQQQPGMF